MYYYLLVLSAENIFFLPGGLRLGRWTLWWIWQDPSHCRALHFCKPFVQTWLLLLYLRNLIPGKPEVTYASHLTCRTVNMTTGPIRSQCTLLAEPVLSMLQ